MDQEFNMPLPKFSPEEAQDIGEELYKREELIESEKILRGTKSKNFLANISYLQGKMKSCLNLHMQYLENKSSETLSTIPEIASHLISVGKFQEAYTMLESSIAGITAYKSTNTLTYN